MNMTPDFLEMQTMKSSEGETHDELRLVDQSVDIDVQKLMYAEEQQQPIQVDEHISVLMWGIAQSASQYASTTSPLTTKSPTKEDFNAYIKVKIDHHMHPIQNLPDRFKYKVYMPAVFRSLRHHFGINEKAFTESFANKSPKGVTQSGHSGASFYLTHDHRFWVKSITKEEVVVIQNTMPMYYNYIEDTLALTLLPQHLAMYRTTVNHCERYFVILRNVFSSTNKINKKYDLKGSTIGRDADESEKAKESPTLKDNDFRNEKVTLKIDKDAKAVLMAKIERDVDFISSLNLMDYSLLVGIQNQFPRSEGPIGPQPLGNTNDCTDNVSCTKNSIISSEYTEKVCAESPMVTNTEHETYNSEMFAIPGVPDEYGQRDMYYLGIIDVLSYYGSVKKTAHCIKTCKYGVGAGISTVKPQLYASRFLEFLETVFE